MTEREELLSAIEDFLKRTGMTPTRFGREALKEPGLMIRLREGSNVTLKTAERLRRFMREYRPPNPSQRAA